MTISKVYYRGKPSKTPKGICRHCNEKIAPEDRLYYTQGIRKTECKPCRRKISLENNRKKRKTIKNHPLW